ncbi:MAG: hypothetical protein ACO1RX_13105 [Candidatus Sericytochromatia bacterium]
MRYLIVMCVAALTLTACGPNPAAGTNPNGSNTASGNTATGSASVIATKQAYINFLNCAKNQSAATPEQKTLIDIQINAVNNIPDSTWANVSTAMSANADVWIKAYGAACGN